MPPPTHPSEIARETLKLLLTRRMAPSPDNYRAIYNEIAGVSDSGEPFPEREFRALATALPKDNVAQQRLARELDQALREGNGENFRRILIDFIKAQSEAPQLNWGDLIGEVIRQWDAKQMSLTPARKREALEHVLASASTNSDLLYGRLQGLARSWSQNGLEAAETLADDALPDESAVSSPTAPRGGKAAAQTGSRASELLAELRELFAFALDTAVTTQLADQPELAAETARIATEVRTANTVQAMQELLAALKRLAYRLEYLAEDRAELQNGLMKLLQLMIDNVSELVDDDRWLDGQIGMVREIVARPMNLRAVNDAHQRLKEVIFKQSQLKHSLQEAKQALKQMLAGFVDHLAEFADSTSDYHDKIERCVEKISGADDIAQLEDVLAEVIRETRVIQLNAQRSRDDLRQTQQRVDEAEKRINTLQEELERASTLVRHDQLTGALNRRGLDEIFENEAARARRRRSPLAVAMLDIDNFKKLNDSLGHDAGDAALIHLVAVIRDTLRPQDTLARFGGEEFIILLPDTALSDAQKALVRVQRELTRRFFLHDNEKLLITFSAGVTVLTDADDETSVTKRADEAMYQAKNTGKNRVIASD